MKKLLLLILTIVSLTAYSQPTQPMRIRTNLYVIEAATAPTEYLYDGVMVEYFTNYCNCIDVMDAWGPISNGWRTAFGIERNGLSMSVERRDTVYTLDSTQFRMRNLRETNNVLYISVKNVYPANLSVVLHDNYLNTNTSISIAGDTVKYYFSINASPASYDTFRFKMYLTNPPGFVAPVPTTEFKVYPNPVIAGNDVHIEFPDNDAHELYLISVNGTKYNLGLVNNRAVIKLPAVNAGLYLLYDPKTKLHNKIMILK